MRRIGLIVLVIIALAAITLVNSNKSRLNKNKVIIRNSLVANKAEVITTSMTVLPIKAKLDGGIQVFQTFNNCGPASLSMALSYLSINKSQDEIGRALRPYQIPKGDNDDKSVSLRELAAYAEDLGLVAYYRPAGDMNLIKNLVANGVPVIARTLLKPADDIGHYRVIIGYDSQSNEIIQDDSLQGSNLRYSETDFNNLWKTYGYEYLVIAPKDKKDLVEKILADDLDETKAWEKALDIDNAELNNNPNDVQADFNKVVALYHLGRYTEAVDTYEKIENKLPFRTLWYQIEPILAYYRLGRQDRVLQISNQILARENRAYSELYQLQGMIYQSRGDEANATEQYEKASYYNSTRYWKENLK